MKIANSLWAVVERSDEDGGNFIMRQEIFNSRQDARDYLYTMKRTGTIENPRSLFIRKLSVSNKRG